MAKRVQHRYWDPGTSWDEIRRFLVDSCDTVVKFDGHRAPPSLIDDALMKLAAKLDAWRAER